MFVFFDLIVIFSNIRIHFSERTQLKMTAILFYYGSCVAPVKCWYYKGCQSPDIF